VIPDFRSFSKISASFGFNSEANVANCNGVPARSFAIEVPAEVSAFSSNGIFLVKSASFAAS
jgi:hypothetical protein